MGVRILNGRSNSDRRASVLYDSVSGFAFGPLFDSQEDAEEFLATLTEDARTLTDTELRTAYAKFAYAKEEAS